MSAIGFCLLPLGEVRHYQLETSRRSSIATSEYTVKKTVRGCDAIPGYKYGHFLHPVMPFRKHQDNCARSILCKTTMAILKPTLLAALVVAVAATTQTHSANPGVGSNPKAQGATDDVTPSTGPNGYPRPIPS